MLFVLVTGASNDSVGEIRWGEAHTAAFPNSWVFPAFDLSVCGRSLLGNVTSSWPAVLSTGSACLDLPQEVLSSNPSIICAMFLLLLLLLLFLLFYFFNILSSSFFFLFFFLVSTLFVFLGTHLILVFLFCLISHFFFCGFFVVLLFTTHSAWHLVPASYLMTRFVSLSTLSEENQTCLNPDFESAQNQPPTPLISYSCSEVAPTPLASY